MLNKIYPNPFAILKYAKKEAACFLRQPLYFLINMIKTIFPGVV